MKHCLLFAVMVIAATPAFGCDLLCELNKLAKERNPQVHVDAGLKVAYGLNRKQCDKRGGVLILDKDGKKFCSYFPGM